MIASIVALLPSADAEHEPLMSAVLASLDQPAEAWLAGVGSAVDAARGALLDLERHGAREGTAFTYCWGIDSELDDAFLDLWSSRDGLRGAVEVLARCQSFDLMWRDGLYLEPRTRTEYVGGAASGIWLNLRRRLADATDAEHAGAREAAGRLRVGAPSLLRCSLAYAFPDQPAWAAEDAASFVAAGAAGQRPDRESWLLASLRDPELATRVVERCDYPSLQHASEKLALLRPRVTVGEMGAIVYSELLRDLASLG